MRWNADWRLDWRLDWRGIDDDLTVFPGYGPDGAATFALSLENGYTVTYRWPTDVIKTRSGKEQRISRNDRAKESYDGQALLFGDQAVTVRNTLARYAALGSAFLLGLPHEALSMRLASSGTTVYVHDTSKSDWLKPGQRVIVLWTDADDPEVTESVDAVVQSTTSNTITLDVAPGDAGQLGALIMPAMAVYLEPEQAFPRYPTAAEAWDIRARAALFDFAMDLRTLALGPLTVAAGLEAATVTARHSGAQPTLEFRASVGEGEGLSEFGNAVTIYCVVGATTLEIVLAALEGSTLVKPTGTWGSGTIAAGDIFAATALDGGATSGPVGTGASVTTYASHPLWDRPLENDSTITDNIYALTEILDYGGVPVSVGSADMADWGRTIQVSGELGAEFQWLKLFLATVKGQQKAFWLSTQRDDLPFVSKAAGTITVEADVAAWYPAQRQHVEVVETSGTVTRAQVTAAANNGDGTYTLTIGTTLASSSVERVSWLELCRMTSEGFAVEFDAEGWSLETTATVVQQ